jgi:hypothetical protein
VVSKTRIVNEDGVFMTTLRLTQPSVHLLHICGGGGGDDVFHDDVLSGG